LNYRHAFHAGNFADLVKHALLTSALAALTRRDGPLTVIDTHGGAGVYDLAGPAAKASGEAEAGIVRLMADAAAPAVFAALKAGVARLNSADGARGGVRLYPGSPRLVADGLRAGDRLIACELRRDDADLLRQALKGTGAEVLCEDGYAALAARAAPRQRLLALIDPPFERADDYARAAEAARAALRRNPAAVVLIWLPLKDLETFDGFLRRLEAGGPPPALVVETRLRPLDDPMRMNGCALVVVNPPAGLEADAAAASDWVVRACGGPGGETRTWRLDAA
jgi:23S rRNA (adenine2030-N6)-methyltransferase